MCALFNFYNRWIDASGVHAMSDDAHRGELGGRQFISIRGVRSLRLARRMLIKRICHLVLRAIIR